MLHVVSRGIYGFLRLSLGSTTTINYSELRNSTIAATATAAAATTAAATC